MVILPPVNGRAIEELRSRTGFTENEFDVIRYRNYCEELTPDFINTTYEGILFNLCDGDITKWEEVKKIKLTKVYTLLFMRDLKGFMEWYGCNSED